MSKIISLINTYPWYHDITGMPSLTKQVWCLFVAQFRLSIFIRDVSINVTCARELSKYKLADRPIPSTNLIVKRILRCDFLIFNEYPL
jgi:hypothetical protein